MLKESSFQPAWWLRNSHLQTIYRNGPWSRLQQISCRREQIELPDGDFLHIDWMPGNGVPVSRPIVLILHGLEGSIQSAYARGMMVALNNAGWQGVLMNFRGCSGELNRLPRTYHAGETGDMKYVVEMLASHYPDVPFAAIGYSLGGNALLKYLAEVGNDCPLTTAVTVSVPFDLMISADTVASGLSRIYQRSLLRRMREKVRQKFTPDSAPIDYERAMKSKTFHEFDELVTAPLHGFASCREYYDVCSSRQYLGSIRIPTLLLQATDDPFLKAAAIPREDELSESVTLELSDRGGHVGFIAGAWPFSPQYWLEHRITEHLRQHFPEPYIGEETLDQVPA